MLVTDTEIVFTVAIFEVYAFADELVNGNVSILTEIGICLSRSIGLCHLFLSLHPALY